MNRARILKKGAILLPLRSVSDLILFPREFVALTRKSWYIFLPHTFHKLICVECVPVLALKLHVDDYIVHVTSPVFGFPLR